MTDEEFYYTYCQGCGMCIVDDRKLEPTIEDMQKCDKKGELFTQKTQKMETLKNKIGRYGYIARDNSSDEVIRMDVVTKCRKAIQDNLEPRATINNDFSSYGLKHILEDYIGEYIGNGEAIYAMFLEGYDIKRDENNASFNVSRESYERFTEYAARIKRNGISHI